MSNEQNPQAPVAAPEAVPVPAIQAAAPVAQPVQQNRNKQQGKKRGPEIRIPQAAFKSRVDREAAAIVKKRLGITIEEAEKLVQAGGSAGVSTNNQAAAVAATVSNAESALRAEIEKQKKATSIAQKQAMEWQNKHKRDTTRLRDKQVETELKMIAAQSGVVDVDYAIHLFTKAAVSGKSTEPAAFFAGLKTSHGYLFGQANVEPVSIAPNSAPPESLQPGEVTPTPNAAGAPAPAVNADSMSPTEFGQHLRKYGFSPGMA